MDNEKLTDLANETKTRFASGQSIMLGAGTSAQAVMMTATDDPHHHMLLGATGKGTAAYSLQQESKIKCVDSMTVTVRSIICPNCEAEQEGWLADPRGRDHECDACGETYRVPDNIAVKVF
ncbi:hypothetical protein [Paraburkholderia sp. SIMBA_054]|uniref:hypothetical protein n=1 Tax=Paraburkholderia sp. SIMBA_054 TaxID=3085795 RepID=UPI00397A68CE